MNPSLVRFGILGAARIAPKALVDAAPGIVTVQAVAARGASRAREFAESHGIPLSFGDYDSLLRSPDVDAVYVALPASFHEEWTLRALARGKHVLVEKPATLSQQSALRVVAAGRASGKVVAEAHHSDLHPLVPEYRRALSEIGMIRRVEARFDAPIAPGDIRRDPRLGAGVLTDFGCYLARWMFWTFGDELSVTEASALCHAVEVDDLFRARGVARMGAEWSLSCDMRPDVPFVAWIRAEGDNGLVRFENPLVTAGSKLVISRNGSAEEVLGEGESTYQRQLRAFTESVRGGAAMPVEGTELVRTQSFLDELYTKAGLLVREELAVRASG